MELFYSNVLKSAVIYSKHRMQIHALVFPITSMNNVCHQQCRSCLYRNKSQLNKTDFGIPSTPGNVHDRQNTCKLQLTYQQELADHHHGWHAKALELEQVIPTKRGWLFSDGKQATYQSYTVM